MKKIAFLFVSLVTMGIFSSCGGKQETIEKLIPAANVSLSGQDANAIKIAGDVKLFMIQDTFNEKYWSIRALVPIENTKSVSGIDDIYTSSFDLLDANYSEIHDKFGMHIQNESMAIALLGSPSGSQKNIVFEPVWENISYFEYKKVVDFINRCENINFEFELSDSSSYTSFSSTSPSSEIEIDEDYTSTTSSGDWDSVLDDYEAFVDKYISLLKKANSGDMSALTEYMSYMEKAQDLAEKLDDADDDMTSAQLSRYMKISQKMASAAADML